MPGTLALGSRPGAAVAEMGAAKRRKRGTRDGVAANVVGDPPEAPAVGAANGGRPQHAASLMFSGAPSEGRAVVAVATVTAAAATAVATPVSARPFAFAAAKTKAGFRSSGRNEPAPATSTPSLRGAAVAEAGATITPMPPACAPVPAPVSGSARPFAFAAGAKKAERMEPLGGQQAVRATANDNVYAPKTAMPAACSEAHAETAPALESERHALDARPLSKNAFEVPLPTDGLTSLFAALDGGSIALADSMSPAEVQAGYSEAWSSLPSCFWEETAITGHGGGGDGGGGGGEMEFGDKVVAESPVTRWLGLPQTGCPLEHPRPPASALPSPRRATKGYADGSGTETAFARAIPRGGGSSIALAGQADARSGWSTSGAGGGSGPASASASAAVTAPTRAAEEVRSLPTLIRLGRSMTKGISPTVEADEDADKAATSAAKDALSKSLAAGSARGRQAARASRVSRASAPFMVVGSVSAVNGIHSGGGGGSRTGGNGGSRPGDSGADGAGGGNGVGRVAETEAEAVAAALLSRRKRRKKSRIAPTFVSSLSPVATPAVAPAAFSKRPSA